MVFSVLLINNYFSFLQFVVYDLHFLFENNLFDVWMKILIFDEFQSCVGGSFLNNFTSFTSTLHTAYNTYTPSSILPMPSTLTLVSTLTPPFPSPLLLFLSSIPLQPNLPLTKSWDKRDRHSVKAHLICFMFNSGF